jgi:hypothetical protein
MITEGFQIFVSNNYIQKNNIKKKEEKKNRMPNIAAQTPTYINSITQS